jgi:hypothetical protein
MDIYGVFSRHPQSLYQRVINSLLNLGQIPTNPPANFTHFSRICSSIAGTVTIGWKLALLLLSVFPLIVVDIFNMTIKEVH